VKQHLFFVLLLVIACPAMYGQDCSYRLTGHVHSTVTHENLAGAVVTLGGKSIVTDGNGDFRFDSLCAGNYRLVITHTSYDSISRTVVVSKNAHVDLDLKPLQNVLSEVTVTSARQPVQTGDRKQLSGADLEETRGGSLAEALSKLNGVTMLQTGATIAKPIVRTAQQPRAHHQQRGAAGRPAMGQ
jgi:iron complex outermembrane recepter protein